MGYAGTCLQEIACPDVLQDGSQRQPQGDKGRMLIEQLGDPNLKNLKNALLHPKMVGIVS